MTIFDNTSLSAALSNGFRMCTELMSCIVLDNPVCLLESSEKPCTDLGFENCRERCSLIKYSGFANNDVPEKYIVFNSSRRTITTKDYVGIGLACGQPVIVFPKIFRGLVNEGPCELGKMHSILVDFLSIFNTILGPGKTTRAMGPLFSDIYSLPYKNTFNELLIYLFVQELERQLRLGLYRDYMRMVVEDGRVRGRVLYTRQFRKPEYRQHLVTQRLYPLGGDNFLNRFLKAALIHSMKETSWKVNHENLRKLESYYKEVKLVTPVQAWGFVNKINFNRLTERFQPSYELAKMILYGYQELGYRKEISAGYFENMNRLYEKILHTALVHYIGDNSFRVTAQPIYHFAKIVSTSPRDPNKSVLGSKKIKPDFVVKGPRNVMVVDAKYKELVPKDSQSTSSTKYEPDDRDIYQAYVYAKAINERNEFVNKAALVYPRYKYFNLDASTYWEDKLIQIGIGENNLYIHVVFLDIEKWIKGENPFSINIQDLHM